MTSPSQWIWVWVNSRSWWWTGRPGMLQSMRSQKIGHNWTTELNWTELLHYRWILYQLSYLGSLWCLWPGSYRVMLALWNKFESVQSCSIWWKCLKRTSTNSSLNVGYNSPGKLFGLGLLFVGRLFNYWFNLRFCAKLLQSFCPTLFDPKDCSSPGSSVHEILQARILECVPCPPPGNLPNPGIQPSSLMSPALAGGFFTISTTWEVI